MTTRRVRNPNVIHFTIDGRHGILGARHIAEALHIPYEPIPTKIIPPTPAAPSTVPTPEVTSYAPPTTPEAPPFVPATLAPPPPESSITISTSEFKGLCHTLQTLSTTQDTAAFGYSATPAEQAILSEKATPAEQTMPHEETTTAEVKTPI
ncbi:hypothetical protein AAG906_027969 [Vitis piasezkii]